MTKLLHLAAVCAALLLGGLPPVAAQGPHIPTVPMPVAGLAPETYGAAANGTTEDSTIVGTTCTAAAAASVPMILSKTYSIQADKTYACDIWFGAGAQLLPSTGKTITHQGNITAARSSRIFGGAGTVTTTSTYRSVAWWGGLVAGADGAVAINAAVINSSGSYVDFAAGNYTFRSAAVASAYPATDNAAVMITGISKAVFDRRGASFQMDNAHTYSEMFGWENDTDIQILGGNLIGNRSGLSSTQENAGDGFISTNRVRLEGGVTYTGDWSVHGAPIAGAFNANLYADIAEMVGVGICADTGMSEGSEFILRHVSGNAGGTCFSAIWDQHFAVTSRLTAGASLGATSITVPSLAVTGTADNGSGAVRLTVASTANLVSGILAVSGLVGTTEANGNWYFTIVNATHVDLSGSTFTNAYVSGGVITPIYANGDKIAIGSVQGGYQYTTLTAPPSGGTLTVTALTAAAASGASVVDLKYNNSGVNFVEGVGNKITILRDLGGFDTGISINSGSWTIDGDISNNLGGTNAGLGVFIDYLGTGAFLSVAHAPGPITARGRYANNGNVAHGGYGFYVNSAAITNGLDTIGPVILTTAFFDGNTTSGAEVGSTAGAGLVAVRQEGSTCGASQATCFGANLLSQLYPSAVNSGGTALSATVAANITSMILPPGNWDVTGLMSISAGSPYTLAYSAASISTTSATTNFTAGYLNEVSYGTVANTYQIVQPITPVRMSVTVPTTVYLVAQVNWTGGGTPAATGTLSARPAP